MLAHELAALLLAGPNIRVLVPLDEHYTGMFSDPILTQEHGYEDGQVFRLSTVERAHTEKVVTL